MLGRLRYTVTAPVGATSTPIAHVSLAQFSIVTMQAATDHPILIYGMDISCAYPNDSDAFDPATAPLRFRLIEMTGGGTSGTNVATAVRVDRGQTAAPTVTLTSHFDGSPVQPTSTGNAIWEGSVHRLSSVQWRPAFPHVIESAEFVGLEVMNADATTPTTSHNIYVTLYCEE